MKKLAIGLISISLLLILVVPTIVKGKPVKPTYLTNEDKFYQFQRPGKTWGEKDPGKFNDYWFTNRRHPMTSIYIGSQIYTTELEDFDLSVTQHSWIEAIQKKYKLKRMKIIEEADTVIDEHPAFWSIIEYKVPRGTRKEKIYLVKGSKFYYRLRLGCPKRYFDKHLEEFEQLVKSFKLLPFKVPTQASDWSKLEEKLNPERKKLWVVIGDKEACGFLHKPMKKYRIPTHGFGGIFIAAAEGLVQSSYPSVTAFSPDQKSLDLDKIPPKYHYLFVIPIDGMQKILAEDKCVIVSGKVRIKLAREAYDYDTSEWIATSETEGESYVTLIAAPNKRALKKAITRFFTLTEIPSEPIIFAAK